MQPETTPNPGTALAPLPDLTSTVTSAATLYQESAGRTARLTAAVADFEARVPADGALTPELYAEGLELAAAITKTRSYMETARKPLTQAFDQVRAAFVALEAPADPKKTGTPAARLQHLLNAYAAAEHARQQAAARELALRQAYRSDLARAVTDYLWAQASAAAAKHRRALTEAATPAALNKAAKALEAALAEIPALDTTLQGVLDEVRPPLGLDADQALVERQGAAVALAASWNGWPAQYQTALGGMCDRLEDYRAALAARKKGAADPLPAELEPEGLESAELAAATAAAAQRAVTADTRAQLADVVAAAPAVKKKLVLEVTDPRAWPAVLALFVEHHAGELAPEAWPAVTLERAARWAASLAETTGELLTVQGVTYREDVTAKVRGRKK